MPEWFLCRRMCKDAQLSGQVEGPVSTEFIEQEIKQSRLSLLDQVYDVRFRRWTLLAEIEAFRLSLRQPAASIEAKREWVILQEGGSPEGLLTSEEIHRRLSCGQLRFHDLAWREGESAWRKIVEMPELDRRAGLKKQSYENSRIADTQAIQQLNALKPAQNDFAPAGRHAADQLPANIMRVNRNGAGAEPLPEGAAGKDLLAIDWQLGSTRSFLSVALIWLIKLLVTFVPALMGVSSYGESAMAADSMNTSPALQIASSGPSAAPPVAAPVAAKSLEILALKLASSKPFLIFQTNAEVGETVQVSIKGRTGEILKFASVSRVYHVRRTLGELPTLDLSALPQGLYKVEAQVSGLKRSTEIFIGKRDEQFEAELEKHLKAISSGQQEERKALFYTARRFEALAKELNASFVRLKRDRAKWSAFLADWRRKSSEASAPLQELLGSGLDGRAFPDELKGFKQALDRLNHQAGTLDASVQQKRDIASEPPAEMASEFSDWKSTADQMGARR